MLNNAFGTIPYPPYLFPRSMTTQVFTASSCFAVPPYQYIVQKDYKTVYTVITLLYSFISSFQYVLPINKKYF